MSQLIRTPAVGDGNRGEGSPAIRPEPCAPPLYSEHVADGRARTLALTSTALER